MKTSHRQRYASRAVLSALAAVLMAVLAACSPGDTRPLDDIRAVVATPTPTPVYVPASENGPAQHAPAPELPSAAREKTPEGAAATVAYFWEALDYGRVTGDTSHMEHVTHYMCQVCADNIYRWEQVHRDNAWSVLHGSSAVTVQEVHTFPAQDDDDEEWTAVLFELTQPASDYYQDGQRIDTETTETTTTGGWWAELIYAPDDERWIIEWIDRDEALAPVVD